MKGLNYFLHSLVMTSTYSFVFALLGGLIICLFVIMLFAFSSSIESIINMNITTLLWVIIPVMSCAITFGMLLLSQYSSCHDVNVEKAALGSIASLCSSLVAMLMSTFEFFRNPVVSVFSYWMIKESDLYKNNSASCCNRKTPTVKSVESFKTASSNTGDILKGIAYGFYAFFSMLFGIVIGTGRAAIC